MRINLFTTFYKDSNIQRHQEYITAILKNIECEFVSSITFLLEPNQNIPFKHQKIREIRVNARPTFQEFTQEIIRLDKRNEYNIIANTDIYFDSTIEKIQKINFNNTVLCLNRWDIIDEKYCRFFNKYYSTDTWIFKGLPPLIKAKFYLGQLGCDNRFNYELYQKGMILKNPSYSIYTWHIHNSNVRSYLNPKNKAPIVERPYLYILPTILPTKKKDANYQLKRKLFKQVRYELHKKIVTGKIEKDEYLLTRKNWLKSLFLCIIYFNYSRRPLNNTTFEAAKF